MIHFSKKVFLNKYFSGQILINDKLKLPDPTNIIEKLPAFSIVVLRHIQPNKISRIKHICQKKRILLSIANNHYLAQKIKSEGFHTKEYNINNGITKLRQNKQLIRSTSCHKFTSAMKAQKLGYDFIFYSPIFHTSTHKNSKEIGKIKFNYQTRKLTLPVIALGGINTHNIKKLKKLKIKGFAAIEYFKNN